MKHVKALTKITEAIYCKHLHAPNNGGNYKIQSTDMVTSLDLKLEK